MNKVTFLRLLRESLRGLPEHEISDIVMDYEEHFNVGISKGKMEEEISAELGNPIDIAKTYKEDNYGYEAVGQESSWQSAYSDEEFKTYKPNREKVDDVLEKLQEGLTDIFNALKLFMSNIFKGSNKEGAGPGRMIWNIIKIGIIAILALGLGPFVIGILLVPIGMIFGFAGAVLIGLFLLLCAMGIFGSYDIFISLFLAGAGIFVVGFCSLLGYYTFILTKKAVRFLINTIKELLGRGGKNV